MRRLLLILPLLALAMLRPTREPQVVTLTWDHEQQPGDSYLIYSHTNALVPLEKWSVLTNASDKRITLFVKPGTLFVVTATNAALRIESEPSNVARYGVERPINLKVEIPSRD